MPAKSLVRRDPRVAHPVPPAPREHAFPPLLRPGRYLAQACPRRLRRCIDPGPGRPADPAGRGAGEADLARPVLYSQTRLGLNGQPFRIYKLRTMVVDSEKHGAAGACRAIRA